MSISFGSALFAQIKRLAVQQKEFEKFNPLLDTKKIYLKIFSAEVCCM